MIRLENRDIPFYVFSNLKCTGSIKHFVTTRSGGVSEEPFSSLNLGYGTDDFTIHVLENRHRMAQAMDIPLDYFVMANQVHGTHVEVVTKKMRSCGALYRDNSLLATDAMITNVPEVCLFVMGADCVPILFFDPVRKVIGAAHAGWRGTVKKIAVETTRKMNEVFHCNMDDILVGIGPSIGPCCYEVGTEVIQIVQQAFINSQNLIIQEETGRNPIFNLWEANKQQLIEAGVKETNIETAQICTKCHSDEFYSSRASNGNTGRFGAGIMLTDN